MVDIIEIGLEDLEVNNEVLLDEDTLIADDLPMEEKTVQLGDGNILTTEKVSTCLVPTSKCRGNHAR